MQCYQQYQFRFPTNFHTLKDTVSTMAAQKINLTGKYTWELLFDIDNTFNAGSIRRKEEVKKTLFISYSSLTNAVQEAALKTSLGYEVGAKFDILSASIRGGMESSVATKFEQTTQQRTETKEEITTTTEIEIGPHSRLQLYRLVFTGPGVSYRTDTLSSTPKSLDDVIIDCTIRPINYLERFDVIYTADAASKPNACIQMTYGRNADINCGFGGEFVWLVPVWTKDPAKAATSIEIIVQDGPNHNFSDLAKGAGGAYRYVKMLHDSNSTTRITNVKLWRELNPEPTPAEGGWKRWTQDINWGRQKDYLFICWEDSSIL